jgi:metal-responsive CopG/Arc/MetJ family transcriptional regulator
MEKNSTTKITITLPVKMMEELGQVSNERCLSRSFLTRLALEEYLRKERERGKSSEGK